MRQQKRVVIDANVGCAASESGDPRARSALQFLTHFKKLKFRAVMTDELRKEWHRNASRFSSAWLGEMFSKGRVATVLIDEYGTLERAVSALDLTKKQGDAMRKDLHLLKAALHTDRSVASDDETSRSLFKKHCRILGIARLLWINPLIEEEGAAKWLKEGARLERSRQLCPDEA